MATDDFVKKPRKFYVTKNKYQEKIILLVFVPSALIFLTFILIVLIGNPVFSKLIFHNSFWKIQSALDQFSAVIVLTMCVLFLLSLIKVFILSHQMVGAYGRIIRELDEIIDGHSQKKIRSRPNDTLTKDLLKRINVLVEYYVDHKVEKP